VARLRRLFFALWPDEAWSARLLEAAAPAIAAVGGRPGGGALASVDLHVTLCFLGAVGEPALALLLERAAAIRAAAFELEFGRLEWWAESRILAATVARVPAEGERLAAALAGAAREAGLAPDLRAWRPHVTLLRGAATSAPAAADATAAGWPALRLTLPVTRFYLAESQGLGPQVAGVTEAPRYTRRASWPLRT